MYDGRMTYALQYAVSAEACPVVTLILSLGEVGLVCGVKDFSGSAVMGVGGLLGC